MTAAATINGLRTGTPGTCWTVTALFVVGQHERRRTTEPATARRRIARTFTMGRSLDCRPSKWKGHSGGRAVGVSNSNAARTLAPLSRLTRRERFDNAESKCCRSDVRGTFVLLQTWMKLFAPIGRYHLGMPWDDCNPDGRPAGSDVIIIFGGAGFIGSHLVRELAQGSCRVVVADIKRPAWLPSNAAFEYCDVRGEITLPHEATKVYNLAAVHRTPGHEDHEYYETNVRGALNVTNWARSHLHGDLVFTSSIAVYGPGEELKHEASMPTPNSAYGRSKLIAEQIHVEGTSFADVELRIVRPAVVFGAAEGGNFTRLAKSMKSRRFVYPGRTDTRKSCGYVGDLIRAFEHVTQVRNAGTIFNFCYPTPPTIRQICEAISEVGGFDAPRKMPRSLVAVGLPVARVASAIPGSPAGLPERVAKLTASTNIAPAALIASSFEWKWDLREALREWRAEDPSTFGWQGTRDEPELQGLSESSTREIASSPLIAAFREARRSHSVNEVSSETVEA